MFKFNKAKMGSNKNHHTWICMVVGFASMMMMMMMMVQQTVPVYVFKVSALPTAEDVLTDYAEVFKNASIDDGIDFNNLVGESENVTILAPKDTVMQAFLDDGGKAFSSQAHMIFSVIFTPDMLDEGGERKLLQTEEEDYQIFAVSDGSAPHGVKFHFKEVDNMASIESVHEFHNGEDGAKGKIYVIDKVLQYKFDDYLADHGVSLGLAGIVVNGLQGVANEPFTFFLPEDLQELLDAIGESGYDQDAVERFLERHVVLQPPGTGLLKFSDELALDSTVKMQNDKEYDIGESSGELTSVGGVDVTSADSIVKGGIVHQIQHPLSPKTAAPTTTATPTTSNANPYFNVAEYTVACVVLLCTVMQLVLSGSY